jgi:hypothetical protein
VNNGTLALWNAVIPSATDGRIFLRLTVANELGVSTVAYVETASDREFSTVAITSPVQNRVVGGNVCCEGTITDYCFDDFTVEVAPPPFNAFSPVPPGTFTAPVYNDPIVGWNTRLGVADGSYRLRFSGTSTCGLTRTEYRDVVVDNTAPVAVLTAPVPCTWRSGMIPIAGTASDAHFSGWTLQYAGGLASGWTTIASGTSPVIAATFTTWNTTGLTPCAYTVRLLVSDSALVDCLYSNTSEYTVSIDLGCQADINRSGGPPTVQDIFDFLAAYFGGCP